MMEKPFVKLKYNTGGYDINISIARY